MTQSIINFSQLEDRIDAEYYKPDIQKLRKSLSTSRTRNLGELSEKIVRDPNFYNISYVDEGIPLIRGVEFEPPFLDLSEIEHISPETHEQFKKTEVRPGDLLMTVRGTIGKFAIVPQELPVANISPNVILIRPKDSSLTPYLGTATISSVVGQQIESIVSGSVQGTITVHDIESVEIPFPPESIRKDAESLVRKAHQKRKQADEKYREAEKLLEKKLGLEDLDLLTQKTYQTTFSETSDRLDPNHYQPKFIKIKNLLLKGRYKTVAVGEISHLIKYGTSDKVYYTHEGVPFLRVTDIDSFYTIWPEEGKFIFPHEAERLKEYKTDEDDLIISRTGTLGSAIYIDKRLSGSVFGSYFIKVKLSYPKLDPFFVAYFLNSKAGKLQSERLGSGGIQTNLTIDAIKSLIIPILPKPTQQKIAKLVHQSFKLRKESKTLIEKATKKVELLVAGKKRS